MFITEPKPDPMESDPEDIVDRQAIEEEGGDVLDGPITPEKKDLDEFNILSDGQPADPLELLEEGFVDIARLESGGSFGELAIIDGKPRMSTIKCLTRCHFIVLSKAAYNKTLYEIEKKRQAEKSNFIKSYPIFSNLSRTFLNKLSNNVRAFHCTRDHVLYR